MAADMFGLLKRWAKLGGGGGGGCGPLCCSGGG
jgi:hypothetical protein